MSYSAIYRDWAWVAYIRLTNPPSVDDYQCRVNLDFLHGMNSDFSDIRFTDLYGRELKYNRLEYTAGTSATVDVLVPNQDCAVLLYYGNPLAEDASEPDDVYPFVDFFDGSTLDTTKWTKGTSGAVSVSGGEVSIYGSSTSYLSGIIAKESFDTSKFIVEFEVTSIANTYIGWGFGDGDGSATPSNAIMYRYTPSANKQTYTKASGTSMIDDVNWNLGHRHGCVRSGTSAKYYEDGVLKHTCATNVPSSSLSPALVMSSNAGPVKATRCIVRKYIATEPTASIVTISPNLANYAYDYTPSGESISADAVAVATGFANITASTITVAAVAQSTPNVLVDGGMIDFGATASASASVTFADTFSTAITAQATATGDETDSQAPSADAVAVSAAVVEITGQGITANAVGISSATVSTWSMITASAIATSTGASQPLKAFINLDNYLIETVDISRSISDSMWEMTANIEGSTTPTEYKHVMFSATDATGTTQNMFTGIIPSSRFVLQAAANKSSITAYDYGYYLSQQKISYTELTMDLNGDYSSWDAWVEHLLDNAGIDAYKINACAAADKEIKLNADTSKLEAIKKIAEHAGFVFYVSWVNYGTAENPDLRPSAYFVDVDDIDDAVNGLDLPAAETISWPDDSLAHIPLMDSISDEDYNRVIVRGMDSSGTWYTATSETSAVTEGEEYPREYYEESSDWNSQAKADARASALLTYFTTKVYKVQATFQKRYDLKLWQKIQFVGAEFPAALTDMGQMRIISIRYHSAAANEIVTIEALPDKDIGMQISRIEAAEGDDVAETEILIDAAFAEQPQTAVGTVWQVYEDGSACIVTLENGNGVTARIVQ